MVRNHIEWMTYFEAFQVITSTKAPGLNENPVIRMGIISIFMWLGLTGIILLERANHYTRFLKKMTDSNLVRHTPGFISWIFNNDDDHDAYRHNVMNQNVGADQHTTNIIVVNQNEDEVPRTIRNV